MSHAFRTITHVALSSAAVALALSGCGRMGQRAPAVGPDTRVAPAERAAAADLEDDEEHPHPKYPRIAPRVGPEARMRALRAPRTVGRLYSGLMHSHTFYSDGSGTPTDAFARARAQRLDFFGVSEHNHDKAESNAGERRDRVVLTQDLYAASGSVTVTRRWTENGMSRTETVTSPSLKTAGETADSNAFAALHGQEFSTISSGNHLNVFGWDRILTVENGDFEGLYDLLDTSTPPPVVQMNHPDVHEDLFYAGRDPKTKRQMFNDYGFDDYDKDFAKLVAAADPLIRLIEVLSGPALSDRTHGTYHYDHTHENDYYYYLCQGFHLSPSVGHDNHYGTWGNATPARMGVYASALTDAALLRAMRENKTFASEDRDLRLEWDLNGEPMGSTLTAAAETTLRLTVRLEDATDPTSEYVVNLYHGEVEPQDENSLRKLVASDGLVDSWQTTGDGELQLDDRKATGGPEFFYVRVTQDDGDRAWSAPIWLNHPRSAL